MNIARAHVQDREASWSARVAENQEIEINNVKERHTVWVVEAVFPAGNKEIYQIDAKSGKMLVLTETEAPLKEEKEKEEEARTVSPAPSSRPPASQLTVTLEERADGFTYQLAKEEGTAVHVVQSLVSSDRSMPVFHLVRRTTDMPESRRYRLDVLTVDPHDKSFKVYPFADVSVKDTYSVDSLARAYGYSDPEHLVMIRPAEGSGKRNIRYDVVTFGLRTGEVTKVIDGIPPDLSPDFLAAGWVNGSGSKLYLNSFSGGKLWIADLTARSVRTLDGSFKHSWPLVRLFRSPDGERYWYGNDGFQLYDGEGVKLASLPMEQGLHAYPPFLWSSDSRNSVFQYTFDDNQENVLGGEDGIYAIASQGIRIYDRKGAVIWQTDADAFKNGTYAEWSGWLAEGSQGILRTYELERAEGQPPRKVRSSYSLLNVATGQMKALAETDRLEDMERPEMVYGRDGQVMFVDVRNTRYRLIGDENNNSRRYSLTL